MGKTDSGRCWIYVRDDRPFGGAGPPAAMFYYSRNRKGEHPQGHLARYAGILQADAYDGYNQLYLAGRQPGPIREAACWSHGRRPCLAMADIEENGRRKGAGKKEIPLFPIAIEVVRRIDALFEIERSINGRSHEGRLEVRQTLSRPLVEDLQVYMREQLAKLSHGHDLEGFQLHPEAMGELHAVSGTSFTLLVEDGRVCLSNNAAERGLRGIALGRKSWLFCGSDRGGRRAAAMYSLNIRLSGSSARRTSALELDACISTLRSSCMTMHVNKVHHVTTITQVTNDLGEDEDWPWDIANEMEIEDGIIWVYGVGEDGVQAYTDFGLENLIELIRFYKENPGLLGW